MRQFDVVIIGGGMIGASIAWWLKRNPDFDGNIAVIERDPSYEFASTTATNSCIRQQFGTAVNIKASQFGVDFIQNFAAYVDDPDAPDIVLQNFGYLYLSDSDEFSKTLENAQKLQARLGAGTQILTRDQIAENWPFYDLDDIQLGSHNTLNEGYFDGGTIFDWMRKKGRHLGVTYLTDEVVAIDRAGNKVTGVQLASGDTISAGTIVNASGPRAHVTAQMAGLAVPVEPRRRFTFIFDSAEPLDRPLPLTIDPSGVHVRQDGRYFMAGCPPDEDPAVAFDDFSMDHHIWETKVWPALATRIPSFERIKLINSWVGHYAYNTLDQNAILGPHPEVGNFILANGFSGHGLQQSPAIGRGIAEQIIYGGYQSLDLSDLNIERIIENRPLRERAVI